jgi:hypothetical protein
MTKILLAGVALVLTTHAKSQNINDKKILNNLCGCFNVDFKYAETFSPDSTYKLHSKEEIAPIAELALPIEVTDKKMVIQHLLIVSENIIVKHWREEWNYESPELWIYKGNKTWEKTMLPKEQVKGKWTQTIWEVADEPRYQGYSQFVNLDGKMVWQNTTYAPLPRREYSVRSDYNILQRTNRLNITEHGYIHEQDNKKIIRANGIDKLLVEEKGYNTYVRINDSACNAAKIYWEKNKNYWGKVRHIWADYLATHQSIQLKDKVNDKYLHEYLIKLSYQYAKNKITDTELADKIKAEIALFL